MAIYKSNDNKNAGYQDAIVLTGLDWTGLEQRSPVITHVNPAGTGGHYRDGGYHGHGR